MTIPPPHIFKAYDIRGVYPSDLNEINIVPIAKAIYSFFQKTKGIDKPLTVVVGTDMRTSSPILTKAVIDTLVGCGAHVIDVGVVSTPTFYFATYHYNFDAGIQVTASHNPKQWNGMKIVMRGPHGLIKIGKSTGLETIQQMATKNGKSVSFFGKGTVIEKKEVLADEVIKTLAMVGNPTIKPFTIVADAANAMGGQYIQALCSKLPVKLIPMNFNLDGTFPVHQPDPLQKETLVDLQKRVVEENADLGLAPDGDGDRLFFIDEKGNIVPPTVITSIIAKMLLTKHKGGKILVDIRYLLTPKKIVEENNGEMLVTKVGHAYITEEMNKTGALFAGESSAHYFFRDSGNAEAQMPIILFVLQALSQANKPFSEMVKDYQRSFESGEINVVANNSLKILEAVKDKYKDGSLDSMDGVAISYPTWRFSMRVSNTEPLLRLNVESIDKQTMEKNRDELVEFIHSLTK